MVEWFAYWKFHNSQISVSKTLQEDFPERPSNTMEGSRVWQNKFNNKPIVNGSFPHMCVEHRHNRWRTETKNRIILHVKEISDLQK